MNAPHVAEASRDYLTQLAPPLVRHFDLLAGGPQGVARLRELILSLAVRGKLVPQDPADEPASVLLERIRAEKDKLIAEGKIKRDKPASESMGIAPYELPSSWAWISIGDVLSTMGSGWSPACPDQSQTSLDQWAVLKTTAVQVMDYQQHHNKVLPANLTPRPDIEVQAGDILVTRAGPKNRVGICCSVKETNPRLMISDKIVRFHLLGDFFHLDFVVLSLNAGWSRELLEAAKTGMAESQVNISQSDIKAIRIPLCSRAEQARIVAKVEELMTLCSMLEDKGRLEAEQHGRLVATLFDSLTGAESAHELAESWQRISAHFDLLLDRPEAVDVLEQTVLQLAVRGLLVPQDPADEPASCLLERIRSEKGRLIAQGKVRRDKELETIVEDDKPFDLPAGWEWVRLQDISHSRLGKMLDKGKNSGDACPYLRNTNVQWWRFELDDVKNIYLEPHERTEFRLLPGDLLVCEGGEPGRCAIWRDERREMYFQKALHRVRPYCGVLPDYIQLCLRADAEAGTLAKYFTGATIKHFAGQELARYVLSLPPVGEQIRIVTRVEELRRLCNDLRSRLTRRQEIQRALSAALVGQVAA